MKPATPYQKAPTGFDRWCKEHSLATQTDGEIDNALVTWMNERHSEGHIPWVGERVFAAIPCLAPEFGRLGQRKLPRAARALKGWRRPCESREPLIWPV